MESDRRTTYGFITLRRYKRVFGKPWTGTVALNSEPGISNPTGAYHLSPRCPRTYDGYPPTSRHHQGQRRDHGGWHQEGATTIEEEAIKKTFYNIDDWKRAMVQLAMTNLRQEFGDLTLDESLVARETIATNLQRVLNTCAVEWGLTVSKVEIRLIDPPEDIKKAMHKQKTAEQERRSMRPIQEASLVQSTPLMDEEYNRLLPKYDEYRNRTPMKVVSG